MGEARYRVHYTDHSGNEQYKDIQGVLYESAAEYVFNEFYPEFKIDFIEEL